MNCKSFTSMSVTFTRRTCTRNRRGAWWLSGRALDSGGRGFETYLRRVEALSKTLYSPKVLVIHRKRWFRPDMTEKLLTGTLNLNTNKQTRNRHKTFHFNFYFPKQTAITTYEPHREKTCSCHMSRVIRKPAFCICENKDADQLRSNREADQRPCFRYTDSTIPLLPKSEISSL